MRQGIARVVEIGPAKTLSSMFSKSLLKLDQQGKEGAEIQHTMSELAQQQIGQLKKQGADTNATNLTPEKIVRVFSFSTDRETLEQLQEEEED